MLGAATAGSGAAAAGVGSVQHKAPLPPGLTSVGWLIPIQEHDLRYGGNGGAPHPEAIFFMDPAFVGTPLSALTVVAPTSALGEKRASAFPRLRRFASRAVRSRRVLQSDTHDFFRVLDGPVAATSIVRLRVAVVVVAVLPERHFVLRDENRRS